MSNKLNLKKLSFLIYGLGVTGNSVIKFFKKKNLSNFYIWDDKKGFLKNSKSKSFNLSKLIKVVDYIVLSPGVSLKKAKFKNDLKKYKKKIISDIDLLYLTNPNLKSIVVTGSNGKSTTCEIIVHLLKKNNFNVLLGGNIGTPVLNLNIKKNTLLIIEASSFQLSHSQFISPKFAILLNITNDHLDWHGSMQNYSNSKFKIFNLQKKNDFALINIKLKNIFKKKKYLSKNVPIKTNAYNRIRHKLKNIYLKSGANNENMCFVYTLSKLLKISENSFLKSLNTFKGLPHRYEIFLKKRNITFVNDSKATSLRSAKLALENSKNIHWIVGGLPKEKDKISLNSVKKNIFKAYIIGKNTKFFKNKIYKKIKFSVTKNLKYTVKKVIKDINSFKKEKHTILLSPGAASFDQFKNFEDRGNKFKNLSKLYAKKII